MLLDVEDRLAVRLQVRARGSVYTQDSTTIASVHWDQLVS